MPQTIELPDVLASAIDAALRGLWTSAPGQIESYDAITQKATVQATVKATFIGEDGDRELEDIATFPSVPIVFPGGGGYRATFPVARGDTVLVIFLSRSGARWLAQGGAGVDPVIDHHHSLSDAVAVCALRDFAHPWKNAPTDRMSIGHDEGATIEIRQDEIRLGDDTATDKVALDSDLSSKLKAILTHSTVKAGIAGASVDGGSAYETAINARFAATTFGATKVKAK